MSEDLLKWILGACGAALAAAVIHLHRRDVLQSDRYAKLIERVGFLEGGKNGTEKMVAKTLDTVREAILEKKNESE